MRYLALACDYDGTLATAGIVEPFVWDKIEKLKRSGRKLLLVTGRELPDLLALLKYTDLFDRIVAENGAVLYRPESKEEVRLAPAPPPGFIEALRVRGVSPLSRGHVIVATRVPHETTVLNVIRDLGLEMAVSFNKGSVMILPSGVNKGTGLASALAELGIPSAQVVGVGDAENDHTFLEACGCFVAVANALPALKKHARLVTNQPAGLGVSELIEQILADDLAHVGMQPGPIKEVN